MSRRRTGSQLQCSFKQQWNMVGLVSINNRSFPVEEEEEEDENEIRTTM